VRKPIARAGLRQKTVLPAAPPEHERQIVDMRAFDALRNVLMVRVPREPGPRGLMPRIGARICRHDIRIVVQAGLHQELWDWLQDNGFRTITVSPDRRRYRDVPASMVRKLFDAPKQDWSVVLVESVREARKRPLLKVGRGTRGPSRL
jgi:hypothetical protein